MSLGSANTSQHATISAPGLTDLQQGPYTLAVLHKNVANIGSQILFGYQADNFSQVNLYFDGDVWNGFVTWDANYSISSPAWRWLVVDKASGTVAPRAHVGIYTSSGAMTWGHSNMSGTRPNFAAAINRFSIGDEFGSGMVGDVAAIAGFNTKFATDTDVENAFVRSSSSILNLSPGFFAHWPQVAGISAPFVDLAGGGVEDGSKRLGSWTASADPPGYDFSLGRSGKVKRWNGTSWDQHPVKRWNGTSWEIHPIKGYNGTDFIASK